MKATINTKKVVPFNGKFRKEKGLIKSYLVISPELQEVAEMRIYATNSTNYACFWLNKKGKSGTGKSGVFNADRLSEAGGEALSNAGFDFSEPIRGRGPEVLQEALLAVAEAEGFSGCKVFSTHP